MDQAALIFDERTVGVWFVHTTERQDWMAHVREITPDEKYEIVYRFRNYRGEHDKVFDSDDEKRWYRVQASGTRNFVIAAIRGTAKELGGMSKSTGGGGESYEYLNDKGIEEFFERFQDAPFVYVRPVKKS